MENKVFATAMASGLFVWTYTVEPYRIEEACKAHLATSHLPARKEGVPHMIKSPKLVPMEPLDPDHADGIFNKWLLPKGQDK